MSNEQKVQELISIFVCSKDHDIENFLRDKAILFEKLGKSRTFFVFDEATDSFQMVKSKFVCKIPVEKVWSYMSRITLLVGAPLDVRQAWYSSIQR